MKEASIHLVLGKRRATVSVSAGMADLLGISDQDFLKGRVALQDRIHKDDADIAALLLGNNISPAHGSVNFRVRRADGHIICVKGEYKKSVPAGSDDTLLELRLIDAKALAQTLDLASHTANFRAMLDYSDDYIYFKDRNHVFTGASQTLVSICEPAQHWTNLLGLTDYDVFPEQLADVYYALEKKVFSGASVAREVQEILGKDGQLGWVDNRKYPVRNEAGEVIGLFGIARDITAEKENERRLKRLNRNLRLLSDCNMALIHAKEENSLLLEICRLCVDKAGYLMAWVGYALDDADRTVQPVAQCGDQTGYLGQARISWADTELGHGPTGTAIRTAHAQVSRHILTDPNMKPWRALALQRHYQSSAALPLICDEKVLGALMLYAREPDAFDSEELGLLMELASDLAFGITTLRTAAQHAEARQQLEFLSTFDALTKLPNRLLLQDRFEQAAAVARAQANTSVALLYLDLDHFKQINDSLGYAVGDQVLVMSVARLQQCIPKTATLSRLGGDEFVLLLSGGDDVTHIAACVTTILERFSEPFNVAGSNLSVPCTIGISLFPSDAEDFNVLLKHARAAVDSAKEAGRKLIYEAAASPAWKPWCGGNIRCTVWCRRTVSLRLQSAVATSCR